MQPDPARLLGSGGSGRGCLPMPKPYAYAEGSMGPYVRP